MPLLEVRKLTMRFGGLTAVNQVDFSVEAGQIFSVIGPNGAGKTTVFNAVTGVYEPTEGEVLFEGRDPRRPLTARVIAGIALVGLLSGLALAVFSADIDAMWRTVIVLNTPDPGEPFPVGEAVDDAWSYLTAGVMTEREDNRLAELEARERQGKWIIRGRTTKIVLESFDDEEARDRRLELLEGMFALAGTCGPPCRGRESG
jgi:ABC-type cobalamin/Fe3+-siderophores transport system ATPase subunit